VSTLDSNSKELIHHLLEDTLILSKQLAASPPPPVTARTSFAPILRKWISEGLFFQAQKLIPSNPITFEIISDPQATKLCQAGVYEEWMSMIHFGTVGIGTGRIAKKYLGADGKTTADMGPPPNHQPAPQKASIFFNQKILFLKGNSYTRTDIIKMLANKLGGVHFDAKIETHVTEIRNHFGFEIKGSNYQMLIGNEIAEGRADQQRRERIYDAIELIAIDTGRIFANGIGTSEPSLRTLLA
jgi:hypothetical protein